MQINEIFKSISGESIQAGRLATFIRTQNCPLRCSYCDTTYALEGECGKHYFNMSIDEIFETVESFKCKYVVFTGGEPLIQKDSMDLIYKLIDNGYHVEIETCGAVDISEVVRLDNVTVTMDWKCPSSGMLDKMIHGNLKLLRKSDVLKCVVGSQADLDEMRKVSSLTKSQVFVSPVFGNIEPSEIVDYMLDNNMTNVRIQLQLHKIIYPVDMRGV